LKPFLMAGDRYPALLWNLSTELGIDPLTIYGWEPVRYEFSLYCYMAAQRQKEIAREKSKTKGKKGRQGTMPDWPE
jgi:hypothetical protein